VYFCRPEDDVVLKRLEGSAMIPPLPDGEEEEEVKSKEWIIRRALAHRVNLQKDAASAAANWDSGLGTEQKSQRAYL
jgi:hypothetical protein